MRRLKMNLGLLVKVSNPCTKSLLYIRLGPGGIVQYGFDDYRKGQ